MDAKTRDCLEAGLADIRRRMSRQYSLIALCLAGAFSALYITARFRLDDAYVEMHLLGFFFFALTCLVGGHAWCALETLQDEHDASAEYLDFHDSQNTDSQIPDARTRKAHARSLGVHHPAGQDPPSKLNNHHPFDSNRSSHKRKGQ